MTTRRAVPRRILRVPLRLGVVVVAVLVHAACAGSEANEALVADPGVAATNDPPAAPASTEPTETADPTTSTGNSTTGSTIVDTQSGVPRSDPDPTDTPEPVSSVLTSAAGPIGWPLPAGRWVADTFEPPLEFDTDRPWVVTRQSPDAIHLSNEEATTALTVFRPLSMLTPSGPVAPPADLVDFITAQPETDVVAAIETSVDGRAISDLELSVTAPIERGPTVCVLGPACTAIATTQANELIYVLDGVGFHVAATDIADSPVMAVTVTADPTDSSTGSDPAIDLLASLEVASDATPVDEPTFLADAGVRESGVPAGTHVAHLRASVARFDLPVALERPRLQLVEPRTLVFVEQGVGSMAVLSSTGLIDPDSERMELGRPPADAFLEPAPTDAGEFEVWLEQMAEVTELGSTMIGGYPAAWWDIAVEDSTRGVACGPRTQSGDGVCVDLLSLDVVRFASDRSDSRLIWVAHVDVIIHLLSVEGGSVDDVAESMQPLLDSLTLTPTGRPTR